MTETEKLHHKRGILGYAIALIYVLLVCVVFPLFIGLNDRHSLFETTISIFIMGIIAGRLFPPVWKGLWGDLKPFIPTKIVVRPFDRSV